MAPACFWGVGFDPATPLLMRHAAKAYDSFQPVADRRVGGWTYEERETSAPCGATRWMPFADIRHTGKNRVPSPRRHPRPILPGNRFHGDTPDAGEAVP